MSAGNDREFIDYLQAKEKEERALKCPLFRVIRPFALDPKYDYPQDCIQEQCAWWTPWDKSCAVLTLTRSLSTIDELIEDIRDKMPRWEQFGK